MTGERRAHREAEDHHHPNGRRGGGAALGATRVASMASTDVPAAPAPMPTRRKAKAASARPATRFVAASAVRERRADAAERQRREAADDPGRATPADVGAISPGGAQNLDRVMRGDEHSRHKGRQRQFHHHDAIDGRGHQNDDGAERGLDKSEPDNA